ncbi:MAG: polymerase family sigma subunit [Ilumatobacteraceae bacterium]|nr:polymerase family sigma subunit [Ilumatobacteraceae bacterium]
MSLLDLARAGDGAAFEELVAPHRRELLVHCYRSLGSMHDAEDVLQEVLMSAWRGLDRFDGLSLRAWLYRIATNRCLNHRRDESRRPQPAFNLSHGSTSPVFSEADDPWWLEPYPDALLEPVALGPEAVYEAGESIALSFVAGLQQLPVHQRMVLVLRDVLGFPANEAAEILGTTTTSVNSALVRARAGFRPTGNPDRVRRPRSVHEATVVDRFVEALQRGDVADVLGLLSDDARLSMPPEPVQCKGPAAVVNFLQQRQFWGPHLTLLPTRANGHPAFVYYLPDPTEHVSRASGVIVLTVADGTVSTLTRFGGRDTIARFGLPLTLPRHDDDHQSDA